MSRSSQVLAAVAAISVTAACSLVRHVDDLYGGNPASQESGPIACTTECLGGACVDGQCQPVTLLAGRISPWGVAVADGSAYRFDFQE